MRKIYKIPVIGKILHAIAYIKNLPVYLREHTERMDAMQRQIDLYEEASGKQNSLLEQHYNSIVQLQDKSIQDEMLRQLEWNKEQIIKHDELLKNHGAEFGIHKQKMNEIEQQIPQALEQVLNNADWVKHLNRQLSINPTVWGEENRLHISPLAAVFTCFFNTNSGNITIGDYTFAGSNVNILAGSHDMNLEGLIRRDAEIKEGCDITIGKGVWLAAGCTILGPCMIGDNAVIAAGAVVLPGTVIASDTVYAGVPAKLVKKIEPTSEINNRHVIDALKRENGVLFVQGWSEKRYIIYNEEELAGHWTIEHDLYIYTDKTELKLLCHKNIEDTVRLTVEYEEGKKEIIIDEPEKELMISLKNNENIKKVKIYCSECGFDKVFVAAID